MSLKDLNSLINSHFSKLINLKFRKTRLIKIPHLDQEFESFYFVLKETLNVTKQVLSFNFYSFAPNLIDSALIC